MCVPPPPRLRRRLSSLPCVCVPLPSRLRRNGLSSLPCACVPLPSRLRRKCWSSVLQSSEDSAFPCASFLAAPQVDLGLYYYKDEKAFRDPDGQVSLGWVE